MLHFMYFSLLRCRISNGIYSPRGYSSRRRIIGKYIRQTQDRLQTAKQGKSTGEKENTPLLEKMLLQRVHVDDISTLLMDMIILGVQAVSQ